MMADILFVFWIIAMVCYFIFRRKIDNKILEIYCKYMAGVYNFWQS